MNDGRGATALFLLTDLIWMLAAGCVFSVFVYWANYGDFRWYLAAGVGLGFVLYLNTVGRLTAVIWDSSAALIRLVLRYTVAMPAGLVCRVLRFIWRKTLGLLACRIRDAHLSARDRRYLKKCEKIISLNIKQ